MTKSELIQTLCEKLPHLIEKDVELAVNCILEQISQTIAAGERIEIRDFGSFTKRHRSSRTARNPKTGETFELTATTAVHFKPGKQLKDRVNDNRKDYPIKKL